MKDVDGLDFLPGDEATGKPHPFSTTWPTSQGIDGDLMEKFMENKTRLITVK